MKLPSVLQDYTHLIWTINKEFPVLPGTFLKSYQEVDGIKHYYKLSDFSTAIGCFGHESLNEIVAGNIAKIINLKYLNYSLVYGTIQIDDKQYTVYFTDSENFCKNPLYSKISLEQLYDMLHNPNESTLDFTYQMGWKNEIQKMMVFDFLICNRDRHGANIEIMTDGTEYQLAPFFDNGLSFFFSCYDNIDEINQYKTNLDCIVNNYIGTRSLKDNLEYVSLELLQEITNISFSSNLLFEGLEDVNLPYIKEYKSKIEEIFEIRFQYLKDYVKEKKILYTLSV